LELVQENKKLAENVGKYESQVQFLQSENEEFKKLKSTLASGGTITSGASEEKLLKLQDELTNSYKRNAENATAMIEMNQNIKELKEKLKSKKLKSQTLKQSLADLEAALKKQAEVTAQEHTTLQVLRDELSALHIEMLKADENLRKLQGEHSQLLDRWIKLKAEEAKKLNEANEFYNEMVKVSYPPPPHTHPPLPPGILRLRCLLTVTVERITGRKTSRERACRRATFANSIRDSSHCIAKENPENIRCSQ
jgi:autophagy-related protein 16